MGEQRKNIELGVSLALLYLNERAAKLPLDWDMVYGRHTLIRNQVLEMLTSNSIPAIMQNVHLNEGLD